MCVFVVTEEALYDGIENNSTMHEILNWYGCDDLINATAVRVPHDRLKEIKQ